MLVTSAGLMTLAGLRSTLAATDDKPNIPFILADDMGYADLSVYGRRDFKTPVLDKLARDGLSMSAGYANSAVCPIPLIPATAKICCLCSPGCSPCIHANCSGATKPATRRHFAKAIGNTSRRKTGNTCSICVRTNVSAPTCAIDTQTSSRG